MPRRAPGSRRWDTVAEVATGRPSAALLLALALAACAPQGRQPVEGSASTGLVFVRRDADAGDLYRVRLSDGALRPLVTTRDHDESWPFWSDSARRLVFQTSPLEGSHPPTLRLLDPASGRVEPVLPADALRQNWPAWAPRAPRLAFVFHGSARAASGGVGMFDLATARFEPLVVNQGRIRFYRPEFAPDDRRLVVQRRLGEQHPTLWILEPGAEPRGLTGEGEGFDQKGRFTRDGAWVVFTRRAARGAPGRLMRIRPDGSELAPLLPQSRADDHSPWPSPARDEIAFISERGGEADAYLLDLAGGGPPLWLTRTPGRDEMAPRWSPDGEYLVLTTRPAGSRDPSAETRLLVVDRAGRPLLGVPGTMPDWMPAWE